MRSRITDWFAKLGTAVVSVATVTVISLILWRIDPAFLPRVSPFLFLIAVLHSSWKAGYIGGVASFLLTNIVAAIVSQYTDGIHRDVYRMSLLLLLSLAVSWIEGHRRRIERELRAGVASKTAQLEDMVARLESEIQERRLAEAEIRRLNQLLERRVDERTRQLEFSNQELESFSYSVSHDLRAPLRSIDGFSRILLQRCASQFDADQRGLFQRILASTERMNELIEDLLNLSRVTRTELRHEALDLSTLAAHIVADLRTEHPESSAEFIIEPGLQTSGDRRLVEVVLRNLLENAWKFSSLTSQPRIEVGSVLKNGQQAFFVRDNGAGFEPAYKSKLFIPFQRLHRQEEFPGTGIGLATVSRIVKRHNGWIEADSFPGRGATFLFTLSPAAEFQGYLPAAYLPEDPNPPAPRFDPPSSSSAHSTLM